MADEHVRTEQFGEFVKRMDQCFQHVNELADQRFDSMNQRILDLEKRMEQGFVHVEQRFEQVEQRFEQVDKRFDSVQVEIRSLRSLMVALYAPIALGIVGVVIKYLFFSN